MKSFKKTALSAAIGLAVCSSSHSIMASDIFQNEEVQGMVYLKVPFGDLSTIQKKSSLGFSIKTTSLEPFNGTDFSYQSALFQRSLPIMRRELLDIQIGLRNYKLDKLNIGSVDALTYRTILHANGSTSSEPSGISKTAIVAGVAVGVVGGWLIANELDHKKNNSSNSSCSVNCGSGSGGGI